MAHNRTRGNSVVVLINSARSRCAARKTSLHAMLYMFGGQTKRLNLLRVATPYLHSFCGFKTFFLPESFGFYRND